MYSVSLFLKKLLFLSLLVHLANTRPAAHEIPGSAKRSFKAPLHRKRQSSASLSLDSGKWRTEVTIGGQTLTLELDTGSFDLYDAHALRN